MITKIIKDNLKEWDVEVDIVKSLDTVRYTAYDLKLLNRKTDIFKHEPILNVLTLAVKSPYSIAYDSSRLDEDSTIRISIPKSDFKPVNIADLINNIDKKVHKLPIIFGLNVENNIVVKDLSEVGHILMAGATGSGKSMFAHTILYTLMSLYEPDYVSFYLVDMKRIEFGAYKGSPYLQADPLMGLYDEFNNVIHTLEGYIQSKPDSKYTVILIDTFSDLICHNREKYEDIIKRLSVKENTFIVMMDSRPSTDVYTSNIFDVFGTKIVFNMVSGQQSKFFCGLDIGSKLLGKGDAVITGKSFENPTRVQCPYISDKDIEENINKKTRYFAKNIDELDLNKVKVNFGGPNNPEKDEKLIELFGKAYKKEVSVYQAVIKTKAIKPFCNYKPSKETLMGLKTLHIESINRGEPLMLHVYPEGDDFIMSDDYSAYYIYLDLGFDTVPCILLGDSDSKNIIEKEQIEYKL